VEGGECAALWRGGGYENKSSIPQQMEGGWCWCLGWSPPPFSADLVEYINLPTTSKLNNLLTVGIPEHEEVTHENDCRHHLPD
jgi:hypothetical protein